MQKDISPEEKLLSIIKGNHDKPLAEKEIEKAAVKEEPARSGDRLDGYLSFILKNNFLKSNIFDPDNLKIFNKYMAIILVVFIFYFIGDLFFVRASRKASSVISGFSIATVPVPITARPAQIETRNYSYYSNKISGKKVFGAGYYGSTELREGMETAGEQAENNIGLVGIIPGDKPQAIIEEKKSQKTYYLMKGQSVSDINVEDIEKDKVTIEYKGRRMSLFL